MAEEFAADLIDELRIYIVVRKDCGELMSKPKFGVQVAHAVLSCWAQCVVKTPDIAWTYMTGRNLSDIKSGQAKIVLEVKNEKALRDTHKKILENELVMEDYPCVSLITDAGRTEFEEPTLTALAVGPIRYEHAKILLKRLQLYKE